MHTDIMFIIQTTDIKLDGEGNTSSHYTQRPNIKYYLKLDLDRSYLHDKSRAKTQDVWIQFYYLQIYHGHRHWNSLYICIYILYVSLCLTKTRHCANLQSLLYILEQCSIQKGFSQIIVLIIHIHIGSPWSERFRNKPVYLKTIVLYTNTIYKHYYKFRNMEPF